MQWLKSATQIGGCALPAGIALWHLRGLHQSTTFATSVRRISSLMGVSEKRARNGLRKLEVAGLVVIQPNKGARSCFVLPSFNPRKSEIWTSTEPTTDLDSANANSASFR